jgi:hypothetical protein
MKLTKDEFRKLQREWYKKLEESGFKDIERFKDDELVFKRSGIDNSRCIEWYIEATDLGTIEELSEGAIKAEYFRIIAQTAKDEETTYRNEVDRHILIRHSEGAKIKTIVTELQELGMPRHRLSVRFIIRRYEMLWGLRRWTRRQLNKK